MRKAAAETAPATIVSSVAGRARAVSSARLRRALAPSSAAAIAFVLLGLVFHLNPNGLRTPYGDGGGRWEDRVDSFSERLVINKVMDEAWGTGATPTGFLILGKGYARQDYSYYPDGGVPYYSTFALQARALGVARAVLGVETDRAMERFVAAAKAATAWATALLLAVFVARLRREYGLRAWGLALVLLASSAGLTLFAPNLFFVLPAFLAPFAIVSAGYGALSARRLFLLVLAASIVNFLCRYEFTTTFAVLSVVPFFTFRPDDPLREKARLAAAVFAATVAGFLVALSIHLWDASQELGSVASAARAVLDRAMLHTATLQGVASPFSLDFLLRMKGRLLYSGLVLPLSTLSVNELLVLAVFLALPFALRRIEPRLLPLWGVGLFTYVSWYLFGYHHVMWHEMYDWLIFALGVLIALAGILARVADRLPRQAIVIATAVVAVAIGAHAARVRVQRERAPPAPREGARAELVADDVTTDGWRKGIRIARGRTDHLCFRDGSRVGLAAGQELSFAGTGPARVIAVTPAAEDRGSVCVTVDRNLWPERDGVPYPVRIY